VDAWPGDWIKCINARGCSGLTKNKLYLVIQRRKVLSGYNPVIFSDDYMGNKRHVVFRHNRFELYDMVSENLEKLGF
jgi:hypothetical protein